MCQHSHVPLDNVSSDVIFSNDLKLQILGLNKAWFALYFCNFAMPGADVMCKQKQMLKTMSTPGLMAKWYYLKRCAPTKNAAHALAQKIEKELIRRGALIADDDETTLSDASD